MAAPDPRADEKRRAAERSLAHVAPGMAVGLGSGSTAELVIERLGTLVAQGLAIHAVATSRKSEALARRLGIPIVELASVEALDVTIDGADAVDPQGGLIKGLGGALLREKVVASCSRRLVIAVDGSKLRPDLTATPIPVEVFPFAAGVVARALAREGAHPVLRLGPGGEPYLTDQGNQILDVSGLVGADPEGAAARLDRMVGVAEHGLFLGFAPTIVSGV